MFTRLLAEQPILLSVLLGILGAACLYAWLQTAKRALMIAGIFFFALIPFGWYVSESWVTDRERILQIVHETAAAVNRNDFEAVYDVIDPGERETLRQAQGDLTQYEFSEAKVGQIRSLRFTQGALPPEVIVDVTASVVVSNKSGTISKQKVARRVVLRFRKLNDAWFVTDYTHLPVIGGPDTFSPSSSLNNML